MCEYTLRSDVCTDTQLVTCVCDLKTPRDVELLALCDAMKIASLEGGTLALFSHHSKVINTNPSCPTTGKKDFLLGGLAVSRYGYLLRIGECHPLKSMVFRIII